MRQEHRFVADLYRYLAPFIDASRKLFLSLDGIAARRGVSDGHFTDPDVPDLWFYLAGSPSLTLLEAKVLGDDGRVLVGRGQLTAWRSNGHGDHKPTAWVGADESLSQFWYWTHAEFCQERLDASRSNREYISFSPPTAHWTFPDIQQLALHVLWQAKPDAAAGGEQR